MKLVMGIVPVLTDRIECVPPIRVGVEDGDKGICRYRIKASVDGGDVKGLYQVMLASVRKKAAFPGHR